MASSAPPYAMARDHGITDDGIKLWVAVDSHFVNVWGRTECGLPLAAWDGPTPRN